MTYSPTAFQLTHLLQEVYTRLEQTKTLLATGGSGTTVIDSTLSTNYPDNAFSGYTVFVTKDAGGAGAAPEGEYSRCSSYTTGTLTMASLSTAVAAGDQVTIARGSLYPLQDVIRLCNSALKREGGERSIGTTLTTGTAQTEYAIPQAYKGQIADVVLQTNTGDTDDNQWVPIPYEILPGAAGTVEVLRIQQYASGYTIGLIPDGLQPNMSAYADPVVEYIPRRLAVAVCALEVANWKSAINPDIIPKLIQDYNEARVRSPLKPVNRNPRWFIS